VIFGALRESLVDLCFIMLHHPLYTFLCQFWEGHVQHLRFYLESNLIWGLSLS
jgi:hypothetical protein